MAHSIHVGFLSVNDFSTRMVAAIARKDIISAKNIYVSDGGKVTDEAYGASGINRQPNDASVLMKSEIVVIAASKREFGTVLAPICALTRGRILVSMTAGIDCAYMLERVTRGTLVAAACPDENADGTWTTHIEFSAGFPDYMKAACRDIIEVIEGA